MRVPIMSICGGFLLAGTVGWNPASFALAQDGTAAEAPQSAEIAIDLNRLEQLDRGCRIDLVISNNHNSDFIQLEVDWVFFDPDGVISSRTIVDLAPLISGRTAIKQFVVAGQDCTTMDSALINGINQCEADEGPIARCLDSVTVMSRAGVTLRR